MLFILNKSPYYYDLTTLMCIAQSGDDLLLIADGVIAGLINSSILLTLKNTPFVIYALKNDVEARGLSSYLASEIIIIDYINFVKLTEKHPQQISW